MIVIGLTGSIAMGKSEASKIFASLGVPVFDSDAAVHRLYMKGGEAITAIAAIAPEAIVDGAVDRQILSSLVKSRAGLLGRIEAIVHPLVQRMQHDFLTQMRLQGHAMAVLDIPLLFETGRGGSVDVVVVVSAPAAIQRARALARPGMSDDKLDLILARQLPDEEKRRRADYVVDTSGNLDDTRRQIAEIVQALKLRAAAG